MLCLVICLSSDKIRSAILEYYSSFLIAHRASASWFTRARDAPDCLSYRIRLFECIDYHRLSKKSPTKAGNPQGHFHSVSEQKFGRIRDSKLGTCLLATAVSTMSSDLYGTVHNRKYREANNSTPEVLEVACWLPHWQGRTSEHNSACFRQTDKLPDLTCCSRRHSKS